MGRFGVKLGLVIGEVLLLLSLPGCKTGSPVATTVYPVPASIKISPAPTLSLEIGSIQAFTTIIQNSANTVITEPSSFVSSDTSVVTVASNGLACAGSWDNLASPTICTPGRAGTAQITATAQGVSSAATTVYVHQHIDTVTLQDMCSVTVPPAPCTIPRHSCQSLLEPTTSLPQNTVYEAHAFSRGVDITPTVGQFTWSAANLSVVTLSNTPAQLANVVNGTSLNQVQVTAKAPGFTTVFATIGTATSAPVNFTTCAVQSIALAVTEATTTSKTIIPTVTDTVGNVISTALTPGGIPLTWSSSQSASVTAATGSATGSTGGGATIVASCTPPTCNIGFSPSQPIYPEQAVPVILTPSGGTTTTTTATLYVGSTACGTTENCVSTIIPVTTPSTLGTAIALPVTPNSFVFNRQGSKAFLGTDSGLAGSRGLMELDSSSNTVTQFTSTPGKVLAVSPDGSTVVVSDTADTPNQVFVFDTTAGTNTAYGITGATAADFSPDSLKAYIIAGSTLYVYSKVDALQKMPPLRAPANDVAFFAEGAFAYIAGGDPLGVLVRRTCDNGQADTVATTAAPTFIRALPDATQMLAVVPPDVALINANTTPVGCTPAITDTVTSISLGQPPFTASQLIIAENGSTAYILSPDLNSILVFDIGAQTSSTLSLLGNATPIQASLTPDGTLLLVGASDGMVHEIQTATGVDVTQIHFPNGLCLNPAGQAFPGLTCNPNLVVVKP